MRDHIELGQTPPEEDCAQLGSDGYSSQARVECQRYIQVIREKMGQEPEGAKLAIKSAEHEFGTYYEVVCYYDDKFPDSIDYAFRCESDGPMTWNG